jgi:hypothetical protein
MEDDVKTGSSTYNIIKLNGTNYRSWAQQLEWILDEKDLWELVKGEETKPVVAIVEERSTSGSRTAADDNKLVAWTKKSKKARAIIGSSVTADVMVHLEGLESPVEMWQTLADLYNPKTRTTLLQTVRQFMTVTMEDDDMEKHLTKVKRLKRQVEEQGEKIADTVYNGILLNSIPDTYNVTVSILESQDNLTPEIIINRLMEAWRKPNVEDSGKMKMALLTNRNSQSKGGKTSSPTGTTSSSVKCRHCKKKGHKEDKCWIKHPELRPKKAEDAGKQNDSQFAMSAAAATTKRSKVDPTKWFLDSAASEHFTPHKHLFESYEELKQPSEIVTAEGNTVYGIGKGTITVEAIAGNKVNILHLENVT